MSKHWVPLNYPEYRQRYWLLVFAAIFVGIYTLVPDTVFHVPTPTASVIKLLPGGLHLFGLILFCTGIACIATRFINYRALGLVHALATAYYGFLAVVLIITSFYGAPYSALTAPYMIICSWLHFRAGGESSPLMNASGRGSA